MKEIEPKYCSMCNNLIVDETWFECRDNFLEVNFFDTEEENIFCSKDCFCKYMSLEEVEEDEVTE